MMKKKRVLGLVGLVVGLFLITIGTDFVGRSTGFFILLLITGIAIVIASLVYRFSIQPQERSLDTDAEGKTEKKTYFSKKTQWKIIGIGMSLPLTMMIVVGIFFDPIRLFSELMLIIIPFSLIIFPINALPFLVLIKLTNWSFNVFIEKGDVISLPSRLGTIVAWILAVGFSLFVSIGVWLGNFHPNLPHSSTDSIAFGLGPIITAIVLIPGGFGLGWIIGKLINWLNGNKSQGVV